MAAAPTFEIRRFQVEGNSLLVPERLDALLAPYTGAGRSFNDVQAALEALRLAYVQAGFGAVRVQLPEQQLSAGVVRLQVVEARLRTLSIKGQTHFGAANIQRSLPALREGSTPNTDELARHIRLANENPAKRLSVDLSNASADTIDADVVVQDEKPWKVGAALDNTGTAATGHWRAGVFLQLANVAELDHVLTAQYVTSTERPNDVTIAAVNYRIPLYRLGDSIDLFGVYADVDSGIVGDLFSVRGRGTVAGFRYNQTLRPSASYRHRLSYGLAHRAFDNRVAAVGGPANLLPNVTINPASIDYAGTWNDEGRQLDFNATYVRNIAGGPHGGSADLAAVRTAASADYAVIRWSFNYLQALPGEWQLRWSGEGQYSRDALVSGEQFGIGGRDSVRGFLERELANDTGQRTSVELHTPDFGAQLGAGVRAQALAFYDYGRLARNQPLPGEMARATIASAGAGLRLSVAPHMNLRVDFAHVLRGAGVRARGDERVHFSLAVAY